MGNYHALLAKSPAFFAEQAGLNADVRRPPQWLLDQKADEAFTGGYDVSRNNICKSCFTARSCNGTCLCTY